jgi:hypothetical protein
MVKCDGVQYSTVEGYTARCYSQSSMCRLGAAVVLRSACTPAADTLEQWVRLSDVSAGRLLSARSASSVTSLRQRVRLRVSHLLPSPLLARILVDVYGGGARVAQLPVAAGGQWRRLDVRQGRPVLLHSLPHGIQPFQLKHLSGLNHTVGETQ